jgi:hypothetical protein
MFHNREDLKAIASSRLTNGDSPAPGAVEAFLSIGLESAALARKLFDNTQKLCLSAATHKDAKDATRAMATFVNASYRDISQNAEAVLGIWSRFVRDTFSPPGFD